MLLLSGILCAMIPLTFFLLTLFLFFIRGHAIPQNVTIDDEKGDEFSGQKPFYTPQESTNWNIGPGQSGTIKVDSSKAFSGTWHDSTYDVGDEARTIVIQFTGKQIFRLVSAEAGLIGTIRNRNLYIFHPRQRCAFCRYWHKPHFPP